MRGDFGKTEKKKKTKKKSLIYNLRFGACFFCFLFALLFTKPDKIQSFYRSVVVIL
jgi:hypothetical protein